MNRPPAFQFYPKDWLDFKVQRMSFAAQGVYIKLLCFMWNDSKNQDSILNDDNLLAQALGTTVEQWLKFKMEIQNENDPILFEKNGHLISERLKHEAEKQRKYRELQAGKGIKSAQQRFNRGSTVVQPEWQPKVNSSVFSLQSSSLSSKKTLNTKEILVPPTPLKGEDEITPEDFMEAYNKTLAQEPYNLETCLTLDHKENNKVGTKTRRQLIEALLKQTPESEYWQMVFAKVAASKFLTGIISDKGWKASIDFLIRPGTHIKIMEGKYDDKIDWTTSGF